MNKLINNINSDMSNTFKYLHKKIISFLIFKIKWSKK